MSFCTVDDLKCKFSQAEIECLSIKGKKRIEDPLSDPECLARIECALKDAKFYLLNKLACCFDVCTILDKCKDGVEFPILCFWQSVIARHLLYDSVKERGEVGLRYQEACIDIEKFCDPDCCGQLISVDGACKIDKVCKSFISVECVPDSCIPEWCCDTCTKQCCGSCGGCKSKGCNSCDCS